MATQGPMLRCWPPGGRTGGSTRVRGDGARAATFTCPATETGAGLEFVFACGIGVGVAAHHHLLAHPPTNPPTATTPISPPILPLSLVRPRALDGRFADRLAEAHNEEHLTKFEMLLEAAIDLDRVPDEYLISPKYDARLEVGWPRSVRTI